MSRGCDPKKKREERSRRVEILTDQEELSIPEELHEGRSTVPAKMFTYRFFVLRA